MTRTVTSITIHLNSSAYRLPGLAALLSGGFEVTAKLPCPLSDLLVEQMGVPRDYLQNRIQTLFLNGDPVDDVEGTTVHAGDVLALSAAMPGLVGATMRKQGPLASLRRQVTLSDSPSAETADGREEVNVKLFNMVVEELGPIFLARGIVIPPDILSNFIGAAGDTLEKITRGLEVDNKPVALADLPSALTFDNAVYFTMLAETDPAAH